MNILNIISKRDVVLLICLFYIVCIKKIKTKKVKRPKKYINSLFIDKPKTRG